MIAVFACSMALLGVQADAKMDLNGPFDKSVPAPELTLGYPIGARITTYRDQERAMEAMLRTSGGRAKRIDYGMTNERRPLRVYAISTAKNIARLDAIHLAIEQAAKSGKAPAKDIPAIVWVNETIHGNEPASFESGMMLMYNLVAGHGEYAKALDNVVVILNPCYNPDGHERYAVTYNSYSHGDYAPGSFETFEAPLFWGRTNHYRFDMNRDRVAFSQTETRAEVALMQSWRPQVYLDQHGQVDNYFFPPNPMSINTNVDRNRLNKWTDIFGRACAKAFDKTGWSYFVKDEFDFYYPGYLDSHSTLSGAVGMTHETDGGKELRKTRDDGSIVTLREGAAKHMTTALACISAASQRHDELLSDWADFKRKSESGAYAGDFKRVILKSRSVGELTRLQDQLKRTGVDSYLVDSGPTLKGTSYWSGKEEDVSLSGPTLVVDMAQEYGAIAKALLEKTSDFEKEFTDSQMKKKDTAPEGENYPGPEGTEFYDMTGWALPYAHDLKAWWTSDTREIPKVRVGTPVTAATDIVAWVFPYHGQEDVLAAADLAADGVKISFMRSDMKLASGNFEKGSFVVFKIRNGADVETKLNREAAKRQIEYTYLTTSYPEEGREGPGNRLSAVQPPKIGLIFGNGIQMTGCSGVWYTLDNVFNLPYVSLGGNALNSNSILNSYTAIIAPRGSNALSNTKVKDWVREGGVLIVFEEPASSVATFTNGPETRDVPGSMFRAQLDPRSLLSYGYDGNEIAVPISGSSFPKARKEGGAVVKFADDDSKKLLTGWSWGDETEKALKGTVWLHDESMGRGHIVWFEGDPCDRAMWPGLHKLLLNSMILLPGN
ncbi:MAG: hypothetical protein JST12_19720 [Armatimonadetes bacterium]|nr:hypothetical protein [Armatimonadota bacterium]